MGAFAQLQEGVNFDAIDDKPVDLAFALLVPESANEMHLQLLSRIAFALRTPGFDELLLERPSLAELVKHLRGVQRAR